MKVTAPASKSASLRALLCFLLIKRTKSVCIHNISQCDDVKAALSVINNIKKLSYKMQENTIYLTSEQVIDEKISLNINVGESGFLARTCISILSLFADEFTITGSGTILERDLGLKNFLELISFKATSLKLPLTIKGNLRSGEYVINEKTSSQFLTGLLFALPLLKDSSTVLIKEIVSKPYIDLTLQYLDKANIKYLIENNNYIHILGNQRYDFDELTIESDWSSMAYLIALGAIRGELMIDGIVDSVNAPDKAILNVLSQMQGKYDYSNTGQLYVTKSELTGFNFDLTSNPDLAPLLSILAINANSPSTLLQCHRLRNKESDRLIAICSMLKTFGVTYSQQSDNLIIYPQKKISGGHIKTFNDHRIAMAALLLNALPNCHVTVDNYTCINKSYPDFIKHLKNLGVEL